MNKITLVRLQCKTVVYTAVGRCSCLLHTLAYQHLAQKHCTRSRAGVANLNLLSRAVQGQFDSIAASCNKL
jgi:hypothetical protein